MIFFSSLSCFLSGLMAMKAVDNQLTVLLTFEKSKKSSITFFKSFSSFLSSFSELKAIIRQLMVLLML